MRNFEYIVVFLMISISLSGFSQEDIKLRKSKYFEIVESEHDFGHVKQVDGDISYVFRVKNITKDTLKLLDVSAECGCTDPMISNEVILPDSVADVLVVYEASTHPSYDLEDFYKVITVYGLRDTFELAIKGYVEPDLALEDFQNDKEKLLFKDYAFNFGNIYNDSLVERRFPFYNAYEKSIVLSEVVTPSYIELRSDPDTVATGTKAELVITYNPMKKSEWSFVKDLVKFKFSEMKESVTFVQSATVLERFEENRNKSLDPKIYLNVLEFDIGLVTKGDTLHSEVEIKNIGNSVLKIRKLDATCPCVKLSESSFDLGVGESKKVKLVFYTGKSRTGTQKKKIYIISNDPESSILTYLITGKTRKRY